MDGYSARFVILQSGSTRRHHEKNISPEDLEPMHFMDNAHREHLSVTSLLDRRFVYLVTINHEHSGKMLSWRPSDTLGSDSCLEAFRRLKP